MTSESPDAGTRAWIVCFGVIVSALACLDVLAGGKTVSGAVWSLGLGLGLGTLVGALVAAVFWLGLRFLPTRALWPAAGLYAAYWLADSLGVFARLSGPDRVLGWTALCASTLGGLAFAGLGLAIQPTQDHPRGRLAALRRPLSDAVAILLVAMALVSGLLDRHIEVEQYRKAHLALRWVTVLCLAFALAPTRIFAVLDRPLFTRLQLGLALTLGLVTTFTIDKEDYAQLAAVMERPYGDLTFSAARRLSDTDRDGHSALFGGGDCAPFDAAISPGQLEIPGNGIDDNCRRGDATDWAEASDEVPIPQTPSPASFVLITVDSVRPDYLGMYGYDKDTTPQLDRWAQTARVFEQAYASGAWTTLSLPSMLRGIYPRRLEWVPVRLMVPSRRLLPMLADYPPRADEKVRKTFGLPLLDKRRPVTWWLQRRGVYTAAVVDDGHWSFFSPSIGEIQAMDRYVYMQDGPRARHNDAGSTDAAIEILREAPQDKPFFMWVHYFGPHMPDKRYEGIPDFGDDQAGKYAHEIAAWDREAGRLLEFIDELRSTRDEDIFVVVTADHGETIKKTKRGHGLSLTEDIIRVPLMLAGPGIEPGRSDELVSTVDIVPTIMALTETPSPPLDGFDLRAPPESRIVISETWHFDVDARLTRDRIAVIGHGRKLRLDRIKRTKRITKARIGADGENLIGKLEDPELEDALESYLEQNSVVRISEEVVGR